MKKQSLALISLLFALILVLPIVNAASFNITARNNITGSSISSFNASLVFVNGTFYQEFANVSTSQGGKSTGTYGFSSDRHVYINYTKPSYAQYGSVWQVKIGLNMTDPTSINSAINYTISESCWDYDASTLLLRIYSQASTTTGNSYGQCYDGSWNTITENNYCVGPSLGSILTPTKPEGNITAVDGNYSTGIFLSSGLEVFKTINASQVTFFPTSCDGFGGISGSAAGIIWEEAMWWSSNTTEYSTTNGTINVFTDFTSVNITATSSGYLPSTYTSWSTSTNLTANLTPYILNISLYDENTNNLLSGINVTVLITGSSFGSSRVSSLGYVNFSELPPDNYTITYSATGYAQRQSIYELDGISSINYLSLFLINESDDTIVRSTVYDTESTRVNGVIIYLDKKNLSGTNYYTVESCETNALGQCLLHLELYDTTYRFRLFYDGDLKLSSGDTSVSSTDLTFTINILPVLVNEYFDINNVVHSLTNVSNRFVFTYSGDSSLFTSACLRTVRTVDGTSTGMNTNCSSSSSGTLTYTFDDTLGDEWTGYSYILLADGTQYPLDSLSIVTSEWKAQFGKNGLFLFGFLLIGTMMFAMLSHPIIPVAVGIVAVFALNAFGLISIGTSAALSLFIIGIIFVVMMKRT